MEVPGFGLVGRFADHARRCFRSVLHLCGSKGPANGVGGKEMMVTGHRFSA